LNNSVSKSDLWIKTEYWFKEKIIY
jgi:hypothetical protein